MLQVHSHPDRNGRLNGEPTAEADRGRHPGFPSFNVLAGGPGSLAERSAKGDGRIRYEVVSWTLCNSVLGWPARRAVPCWRSGGLSHQGWQTEGGCHSQNWRNRVLGSPGRALDYRTVGRLDREIHRVQG